MPLTFHLFSPYEALAFTLKYISMASLSRDLSDVIFSHWYYVVSGHIHQDLNWKLGVLSNANAIYWKKAKRKETNEAKRKNFNILTIPYGTFLEHWFLVKLVSLKHWNIQYYKLLSSEYSCVYTPALGNTNYIYYSI